MAALEYKESKERIFGNLQSKILKYGFVAAIESKTYFFSSFRKESNEQIFGDL